MKIIDWIFKRKCCFCFQRDDIKNLAYAKMTIAYSTKYYYHSKCLVDVSGHPEKYGHRAADAAIEIYDYKQERKTKQLKEKEEEQESYRKVKSRLKQIVISNEKFQKEYERLTNGNAK
jgi:hypothetical protein